MDGSTSQDHPATSTSPGGATASSTTTSTTTTPKQLRRVVTGALVGTALEWYDFFIYGTAAALVFNKLFFTDSDPAVGTLLAFATFGVAFAVRPVGGVLFGHLGDRIGRRETLVITTIVMGVATGLIGLLPTYAAIGVWAPILLTLLRMIQGLGAGAEFGGASTLLAEHAPRERRGFYASFAQCGVQVGSVLGTASFLLVGLLPDPAFESWGWRLPFLASFALIAVALWVRLRVEESPVFREVQRSRRTVRLPIREAITAYPRSFLVGVGAHVCDTAIYYIYATFAISYLTGTLEVPRSTALTGIVIYGLVLIVTQPLFGLLSDRIGRRPINLFSVVFTAAFAFPFFLLLNTEVPVLIWLGFVVATLFGLSPMIAVQPAFYAELFGARVRYSGFAASRELGAALVGFSPLIAAALLGALDGRPWLVACWMILTAVISFVAFWFSTEGKDVDITELDPVRHDTGAAGSAADGAATAGPKATQPVR